MANKNIHGFDVEYDGESSSVKSYLEHLERLSHEEVKAFVESAKHDYTNKTTHLEDSYGNRVTLGYKDDHSFSIRKRQS